VSDVTIMVAHHATQQTAWCLSWAFCSVVSQAMLYKLDSVLLPPAALSLAPTGSANRSDELRTSLTIMQALHGRQVSAWSDHTV
jgi:hypothetical protein